MKYRNIVLLPILVLTAVSCRDYLDTYPVDKIASTNMWTSPDLAAKGINGLYETFHNTKLDKYTQLRWESMDGLNKYGIEALGFCTDYYSNTYPVTLLSYQTKYANYLQVWYEWQFCYQIVHSCNDAIANLGKAGLTDDVYENYLCQARFLRAWAYSRLNKLFQGVPLYTEPVTNENCTKTQSSTERIWDQVIEDLTYCIDNPYFPDNTIATTPGRPSKGAAYALRGMAYMWMARGNFVENGEAALPAGPVEPEFPEYFRNAADDFSKVSACGYSLWTGEYKDIFRPENEHSPEILFSVQYDAQEGYCDHIQMAMGARDTYNSWTEVKPAADFVDYYQNSDGTPFSWSEWAKSQGIDGWDGLTAKERAVFFARNGLNSNKALSSQKTQLINICGQAVFDEYYKDEGNEARIRTAYDNRDPRLKQTVVTPYEPVDCYSPTLNGGENMIGKQLRWPLYQQGTDGGDFWLDKRTSAYYCYRKFVMFLKEDGLIDSRRCFTDFPLIRYTDVQLQWAEALIELDDFGGAVSLINDIRSRAHMGPVSAGTKEEMRDAVRYERRVEFAAEALNYFDEVRWGTWKETKFQGNDVHGGQSWWGDNTVEYSWYWDDCLYPWPAPYTESVMNTNLVRRPGWVY